METARIAMRSATIVAAGIVTAATLAPLGASAASIPRPHGVPAGMSTATPPTGRGDVGRTGWYANQPGLAPSVVASTSFGQLGATAVSGKVLAQPLVVPSGSGATVFVGTEADWIYGLDPANGAILWSRQVGVPIQAAAWSCPDISPTVGITSTPTFDPTTGAVYFVDASYLSGASGPAGYFLHAVSPSTGAELAGYPVTLGGTASNAKNKVFSADRQYQRPGLLLLGDSIYIAFSSHCDALPYQGWILGVSTTTRAETVRFVADATPANSGAGIWQSGGGLASDGAGQLLVGVGNGVTQPASGSTPGKQPPSDLSNAVVRLRVDASGALVPTDFFSPVDANYLNNNDLDYGSGAPVVLPDSFGTAAYPHLVAAVGKEGYVDLLNRDNLGGIGNGPGGGDAVVARSGPYGGIWATPAAWPGDGGYLYVPTTAGGPAAGLGSLVALSVQKTGGIPTLVRAGASTSPYGFGSSSPIVTSNGTTPHSAVVWAVRMADGTGIGAQLEAYGAVPTAGTLPLLGSWPVGTASKFNPPGVGDGRLYLGTADGHVLIFGPRTNPDVTAAPLTLSPTAVGSTATSHMTLNVARATSLTSVATTNPDFTATLSPQALGAMLPAKSAVPVTITFKPTAVGAETASLTIVTATGLVQVALSGVGLVAGPKLTVETKALSLGGAILGATSTGSITVTNTGTAPSTITSVTLTKGSPFTLTNVAAVTSTQLASGASRTIAVRFDATTPGVVGDTVTIAADGTSNTVLVTAAATAPSTLVFSQGTTLDFGTVAVGATATKTITVSVSGGTAATITSVAAPTGAFVAETPLVVGTPVSAGTTLTLAVTAQPTAQGKAKGTWTFSTSISPVPVSISLSVTGSGAGYVVTPPGPGWQLNGAATIQGDTVALTPAQPQLAGTAFWPVPVPTAQVAASFAVSMSGGTGADGAAIVFADPSTPAGFVGGVGEGFGFSGAHGLAVTFGTYAEQGAPSENFVGVTDGPCSCDTTNPGAMHWIATAKITSTYFQGATTPVSVTSSSGTLSVAVEGAVVLTTPVSLSSSTTLVGFSGGTGALTNVNAVSDVHLTAAGTQPLVPVSAPSAPVSFGTLHVGSYLRRTFTVTNAGSQVLTITTSQPPASAEFFAETAISPGSAIAPGASLTLSISYAPAAAHRSLASWQLRFVDYPVPEVISLAGTGIGPVRGLPPISGGAWRTSGTALARTGDVRLTTAAPNSAGATYLTSKVETTALVLHATLTTTPGSHCCGDGTAVVFSPSSSVPKVGAPGWGVGFAGTTGLAVVFGEFPDPGAPSATYVGISSGMNAAHSGLHWIATAPVRAPLGHGAVQITIAISGANISVWINDAQVLTAKIVNAGHAYVGFTAGTGQKTATHTVSAASISVTS